MADEDERMNTLFPPPPPFYKHFTPQNVERVKEVKELTSDHKDVDSERLPASNAARLLDLPPELRYLIPPEPPEDGRLRVFGGGLDISHPQASLEEYGIEQLYISAPSPSANNSISPERSWTVSRAQSLHAIVRSILMNFLELLGIMSVHPTEYQTKMQHLRTLFINAHHLINEYRPHQARETLILMMEEQLERKRAEVEGIRQMKEKIEAALSGLGRNEVDPDVETNTLSKSLPSVDDDEKTAQRNMWHALDEMLDS